MENVSRCSIWLVTGNRHKFEEAKNILNEYNINLKLLNDIRKNEIQSESLEEIALNAAINAFEKAHVPLAVDDSGLFIEALNGFPGPYSRFTYDTIGVEGILRLLKGSTNRKAYFMTVVAAVIPPLTIVSKGIVKGHIAASPRGRGGFGFDPIFVPEGWNKTFAEAGMSEKNAVSHRARAFRGLARILDKIWGCRSKN